MVRVVPRMLTSFFLLTLFQDVLSIQCDEGMAGSCQCVVDKSATYQLHCPSYRPDRKLFTVLVKDREFAEVTCVRGANRETVLTLLEQIKLGEIKALKLAECPYPQHSYQELLEKMGASEVKNLIIKGNRGSFGSFGNKQLSNLKALVVDLRQVNDVEIDEDFFSNSSSITKLSLRGIRNLKLDGSSFRNLPNLTQLDLSSSGISSLHENIFKNLTSLKFLNLHGNLLKEIPGEVFDDLVNLTSLNLGSNKLKTLPKNIWSKNEKLEQAILSFNCFENLPENLFADKQNLKSFDLRRYPKRSNSRRCDGKYTRLELPGSTFQNSSIKKIKFLNIDIKSLPDDLLKGCQNLTEITIQGTTTIKTLVKGFFSQNPKLEKVDLVNNKISELDLNIFKGLTKLKVLRLSMNELSFFDSELLADLVSLETLHISDNNIKDIADGIFEMAPIKELDISYNKLDNKFIRSLGTRITSVLRNIKKLVLRGNNLTGNIDIKEVDTSNRRDEIIIDLAENKIKRVLFPSEISDKTKFLLILRKNPLACDCYATEIKQLMEEHSDIEERSLVDLDIDDIICPDKKNILETSYTDLSCPVPSELFREKCPEKCKCDLNRYSRTVSVNCSGQAMTQIPENLPIIPGESERIILRMQNNLLTNLTESLERLSRKNYSKFISISELHLSRNRLRYIGDNFPTNLKYLSLDHNRIDVYPNRTLQYLKRMLKHSKSSIKLGSNPYKCNCESLELLHFLKLFYSHIEDNKNVTVKCIDNEKGLLILNEEELCQLIPIFTILVPAVLIFIVILSVIILHIFYRDTILIYIFSKSWGKIFFSEEKVDVNKPYDAFLSYSHHDEEFVEKILLPGLESEENPKEVQYKCLIHTRDWKVGDMISDQIIESVDSCRRTIIVLSVGYIQSMWTKLEFQAAHKKSMKENTQRLIILLHGEKPDKDNLDEDLKKYLDTSSYIDTKDPWFWKKLRFALPKKSYKQKKSNKFCDKTDDQANCENAKNKKFNDIADNMSDQNKVQLPYYKQFSREMLLTSESLKRDLGAIEYYC